MHENNEKRLLSKVQQGRARSSSQGQGRFKTACSLLRNNCMSFHELSSKDKDLSAATGVNISDVPIEAVNSGQKNIEKCIRLTAGSICRANSLLEISVLGECGGSKSSHTNRLRCETCAQDNFVLKSQEKHFIMAEPNSWKSSSIRNPYENMLRGVWNASICYQSDIVSCVNQANLSRQSWTATPCNCHRMEKQNAVTVHEQLSLRNGHFILEQSCIASSGEGKGNLAILSSTWSYKALATLQSHNYLFIGSLDKATMHYKRQIFMAYK